MLGLWCPHSIVTDAPVFGDPLELTLCASLSGCSFVSLIINGSDSLSENPSCNAEDPGSVSGLGRSP